MSLRKITDATVEPVTLAEAKDHLRITDNSSDAYITALITAARTACEERLRRTLITTSYELTLDEFPDAIALPMPQLIAVATVKYLEPATGNLLTLAGTEYYIDSRREPAWIVPAYGKVWPAVRVMPAAITVAYTAGYGAAAAAVPKPIKQWILLTIGTMFENRETEAIAPGIVLIRASFADALLDPFKVWEL